MNINKNYIAYRVPRCCVAQLIVDQMKERYGLEFQIERFLGIYTIYSNEIIPTEEQKLIMEGMACILDLLDDSTIEECLA